MLDFNRALKYITLAKDNTKGAQLTNAKFDFNIISFIQSSCLKMTGNFADANNSYNCLEAEFQRRMSRDLIELVWGLVLIPLSDDRKRVSDHFHYLHEYCLHLKETKVPVMDNQNLLLSKLCTCETSQEVYGSENLKFWGYESSAPRLDFDRYEKSIWTLINRKSFFKRFNNMQKDSDNYAMYRRILKSAKVELYGKG